MAIYFHVELEGFAIEKETQLRRWLLNVISSENYQAGEINIIFISNSQILDLNRAYLKHNYFTDVITFEYNEGNTINGDIFVSIDQVKENAREYTNEFSEELMRVMVHGVLHLTGYSDSTPVEQDMMRAKENEKLRLYKEK